MAPTTMTSVNSGFLAEVGWDTEDGGLVVAMKNGRSYRYPSAPVGSDQQIISAESPGTEFNKLKGKLGDPVPLS